MLPQYLIPTTLSNNEDYFSTQKNLEAQVDFTQAGSAHAKRISAILASLNNVD